jgi:hypothetical protein
MKAMPLYAIGAAERKPATQKIWSFLLAEGPSSPGVLSQSTSAGGFDVVILTVPPAYPESIDVDRI